MITKTSPVSALIFAGALAATQPAMASDRDIPLTRDAIRDAVAEQLPGALATGTPNGIQTRSQLNFGTNISTQQGDIYADYERGAFQASRAWQENIAGVPIGGTLGVSSQREMLRGGFSFPVSENAALGVHAGVERFKDVHLNIFGYVADISRQVSYNLGDGYNMFVGVRGNVDFPISTGVLRLEGEYNRGTNRDFGFASATHLSQLGTGQLGLGARVDYSRFHSDRWVPSLNTFFHKVNPSLEASYTHPIGGIGNTIIGVNAPLSRGGQVSLFGGVQARF